MFVKGSSSGSLLNQLEKVILFHFIFTRMSLVCLCSLWQCPSLKSDNIVSTHHNVILEIVVDDNHLFTE